MSSGIPVVDMSRWFGAIPSARRSLAREVDAACREWGFLVISNHGVDAQLTEDVRAATKVFFDQPVDYKLRYNALGSAGGRGYYAMESKSHARTMGDASAPGDLRESFRVGIEPGPGYEAASAHVAFNPWPDIPAEFGDLWRRYYRECESLCAEMMRLCALALDLPETWFDDQTDHPISNLAAQHYPKLERPPVPGQIRSGAHTDFGTLTLLLTEDRPGGLQIMATDGSWHDVTPLPGTYIVNLGDMMAQWTNDRWRSTLHRVVNPPLDAGALARRLSMVYFGMPNADAQIRCIPTCTDDSHPPKYAPILAEDHLSMKLRKVESVAGRA